MAATKPTPVADELSALLGEGGSGGEGENLDKVLDALATETAVHDTVEVDLSTLDLSNVVEIDFRPLPNGEWFDADIVKAQGGKSSAGNIQVEFCYMVVSENPAHNGVTVFDQAGVDPRMPKGHWKIKKVGKRVGLLGANDQLLTKNPADFLGRRIRFKNFVDTEFDPSNHRNKAVDFDYPSAGRENAPFNPSA